MPRGLGNLHNPRVTALGSAFREAVLAAPRVRGIDRTLARNGHRIVGAGTEKFYLSSNADWVYFGAVFWLNVERCIVTSDSESIGEAAGESNIGYWLGRSHWGTGIASRAVAQFLTKIETRPVYAHVARHNIASIRVLEKCGFQLARETVCDDADELVMELRSDRGVLAAQKPTRT